MLDTLARGIQHGPIVLRFGVALCGSLPRVLLGAVPVSGLHVSDPLSVPPSVNVPVTYQTIGLAQAQLAIKTQSSALSEYTCWEH